MTADTRARVLDALRTVYDPELDEPITELRFVASVDVAADGDVEVHLRLPTPQCAPNFAFLMAADARSAIRRVAGVRGVAVVLDDHFTGGEINDAIARGEGFAGAFPGETDDDELSSLRERFQRKALVAREGGLCEALLAKGMSGEQVTALRIADLPQDRGTRRCVELRSELGIACSPDAPAFVLADGQPIAAGELPRWLRMARLIRTSLEANGGICRSLLQFRHELAVDFEEVAS
jgi:metal-sulfur cluster biosynthetic enzyme